MTGRSPGAFGEWLEEVPLLERKSKQTSREKIAQLRAAAAEVGRDDLLLANDEYGLGKLSNIVGFNRFTKGLVVTEFALETCVAGYDVAAFWDNGNGGSLDHGDQMLVASAGDCRFNPSALGLGMLSTAADQTMIMVSTSNPRVHGFATRGARASRRRASSC